MILIRLIAPGKRAFTLPEVALAIGVIALGLVGVFSILPFGLTAQKNNQEETIIRYEAQYWHEALLSDGLLLEDINERVDRVEVYDENASVTHTFINPFRSRPDPQNSAREIVRYEENATGRTPYSYPAPSLSLSKAKKYWSSDVQGWLLNPIDVTDANGSFALVRAINGPLFDRFYGAEPQNNVYHFPNRDFSAGYILQVQPENTSLGSEIRMTFYWPLFEEVLEKLEPKPTTAGGKINTIKSVIVDSMSPDSVFKFKTKSFTIKVPGKIHQALTEDKLTLQERRFMREMRVLTPGERIDFDDPRLKGVFKDYYSFSHPYADDLGNPWVSPLQYRPRRMFNNGSSLIFKVKMPGGSWVNLLNNYPDKNKDPSFRPDSWAVQLPGELEIWARASHENILGPISHSGMWLHSNGYPPVQIGRVGFNQVPSFGVLTYNGSDEGSYTVLGPGQLPYHLVNTSDLDPENNYRISFLGLDLKGLPQDWESVLRGYADTITDSDPVLLKLLNRPKILTPRPNLVTDAGGYFVLARRLRVTTHRPATTDEKVFNAQGLALWDWVPDEDSVPRLWRVEQ
tara:strand:- start:45 stop:1757 length:1713 start_codon:yes stop_codon:yes gene_type:complete